MDFKRELEQRLINFAVMVIDVVEQLPDGRTTNHLGGQLLRSGTSPALNYGEALGAESRKDFAHKLGLILKELRESHNCLRILAQIKRIRTDHPSLAECNELFAIFVKSLKTTKANTLELR